MQSYTDILALSISGKKCVVLAIVLSQIKTLLHPEKVKIGMHLGENKMFGNAIANCFILFIR